jgi:hypothetical protein
MEEMAKNKMEMEEMVKEEMVMRSAREQRKWRAVSGG